jgi:hypothetical protein
VGAIVDAGGVSAAPVAIFSAPIAGVRITTSTSAGGEAIAVGLVVASKAIVAARVDSEGRAVWTRQLISGVEWTADAELHAWPIASGAAITWRGTRDGRTVHVRAAIDDDGKMIEDPTDLGSLVCATARGLAWTDAADGGTTRVHVRSWGSMTGPQDELGPPIADEITLTCGSTRAYAVAEGDEGTPTRVTAVGGDAPNAFLTLAPGALGRDEERDLLPWTAEDGFGLVRLASGGALVAIEAKGGAATPLETARARVPAEDDVVAIDATSRAVTLVTTHDESDACPEGRGGSSVLALRIPRAGVSGGASSRELAKATCGADVGPFWTEPTFEDGLAVGWAERPSRKDKSAAPIAAVSYRLLGDTTKAGRIVQSADAVSDAGCDHHRCYVVALARPAGADGMTPEAIRVLAYP